MSMDEIKLGVDINGLDLPVLAPALAGLFNAYLKRIGADPVSVRVDQSGNVVSINIQSTPVAQKAA